MAKEKCDCGNVAKWVYLPGYSGGDNPYVCDDCISSSEDIGCSCNWHYAKEQEGLPQDLPDGIEGKDWRWIEHEGNDYIGQITKEDAYWQYLDEKGRPHPCMEYDYEEDGFDVPTLWSNMIDKMSWKWFLFKRAFGSWWKKHICDDAPDNIDL